jgi:hypothetical protein
MMKAVLATIAVALLAAFPASAIAHPGAPVTITTSLSFPSYPSAPPYVGTYYGTFSASDASGTFDTGNVTAQTLFAAVPSPSVGVLHTDRTLKSADGTLELRCNEIAKSLSDPTAVPGSGTCAVLSATGAYADLAGSGKVTSLADLNAGTFTDSLDLGVK